MKSILAFAAAATTLTAAPALSQPVADGAAIVVSYADLDLSTRAGIRTFDRRIRTAVEQACGSISSTDPAGRNDVAQCRADGLALARAQRDTAVAALTAGREVQLASQR
jgi:UrcA family protein